ncbi:tyrosine-protein phosphatase non-receptor type 18 [Cynoglossus semilaevis]|uniref:tyrosine-protein phosphatase non-receptor type 18 n=1 Tax=Cynoglossus semilaevis TaxID=244447 RepID=UPI0004978819|nr:tyrosine-protein phosphatase non-receptor type 18-like [Cynoglossus semilaevis]
MGDMYATVNKHKNLRPPPATTPTLSNTDPHSGSKLSPSCHYYDNDLAERSAAPVYSCVQRRAKPLAAALSATPIYDIAVPAKDCQRSDEQPSSSNDDYEEFSTVNDPSITCSAGGIGFNLRIQKPRGPRKPPATWS